VSTGSTKQQRRKRKASTKGISASTKTIPAPLPARQPKGDVSERTWLISSIAILLIAAFLRLCDLDLVPLHHDEGVNGNFLVRLVREGAYQYDPQNYHGPTLYYFSAIIPWILRFLFGPSAQNTYGLTTFTMRLIPALFGLATIWLVLLLRRRLGTIGALCAAALLAISPGAVYLSRYFIHETLFTFFTLGLVVASLKVYEDGHPIYLILASISAALLFATKETAFVSAGVLLIAFASTQVYLWLRNGKRRSRASQPQENAEAWKAFLARVGGPWSLAIWSLVAIAVFIGVNFVFYSSFNTNPKGVSDALKTFQFWTKTGKEAHVHSLTTYVSWLISQESPLLFFGTVGAALVVWKPKNSFALFSALWAFGLLAAYSLIAYKTPWLALNFIVPLTLIAGYTFQFVYDASWSRLRDVIALAVVAVAVNGYQTIDLNFFNYDNDDQYYVYVYAHTRRDTLKLVETIDRIAKQSQGDLTGITIVSPDYWPLPWYLRNYSRVGYFARMAESSEPLIIASESQKAEIQEKFGFRYKQVPSGLNDAGSFPLRPGVNLMLYVRRDVAPPG
jgi:uncharacterized protein (TIGR03663 family)